MTRRWNCTIRTWRRGTRCLLLVAAIVIVNPDKGFAQLNGQNIKGDAGLKSGSKRPQGRMSRFRCTSTPPTRSKIATANNSERGISTRRCLASR
jgi:hypothetical protein